MRRFSTWKLSHFELHRKALRILYLNFTAWWLNQQDNNINIAYDNFYSALCKVNVSSTPGCYGVHPQVLRSCAGLLAYPLTLLFERSLRSSDIPSPWKWSVVVPLFKSGSSSSLTNYCPVSLTSVCCKTTERVVTEKFYVYLEEDNNMLSS